MRKRTIYLIPGVGADESVFQFLTFPKEYEVVYLKWLPLHEHDDLQSYVKRLKRRIKKDTDPIYVGLSFGGIVASELAKLVPPLKVFLISSIKTHYERPMRMSLLELLPFHRFLPSRLAVNFDFWHEWAFGKTNAEEKELIAGMLNNIDLAFNEWAVHQAITWENKEPVPNLVHIHGDDDKIFPSRYISDFKLIKGGTHFMIVNKAKQVSNIIKRELAKLDKATGAKNKAKPTTSKSTSPKGAAAEAEAA